MIFLSVLRCYHNALVLSMLAVQLTGLILYFRPLWLFIERSLAMHYISDYEKNQRIWISMCLVTGSIVYSIFGSLSFNLGTFPSLFLSLARFRLVSLADFDVCRGTRWTDWLHCMKTNLNLVKSIFSFSITSKNTRRRCMMS